MVKCIRQLDVLMWKERKFWMSRKYILLAIILVPIFTYACVAMYRSFGLIQPDEKVINPEPKETTQDEIFKKVNVKKLTLLYCPRTKYTDNLMGLVRDRLGVPFFFPFGTTDEVEGFFMRWEALTRHQDANAIAVIFHGDVSSRQAQDVLNYTLRGVFVEDYIKSHGYTTLSSASPESFEDAYMINGYFATKIALDQAYMVGKTIKLVSFPYESYTKDSGMHTYLDGHIRQRFCIYLASVVFIDLIIRLSDKKAGTKIFMACSGVSDNLQFLVEFLYIFAICLVCAGGITFFMCFHFKHVMVGRADWILVFMLWTLYYVARLAYTLMITGLFSNVGYAVMFDAFVSVILGPSYYTSRTSRYLYALCPWEALRQGLFAIYEFEISGHAMGLYNINFHNYYKDTLTMGEVYMMLVVAFVIYTIAGLFIHHLYSGITSGDIPWYFPFQRLYRCCCPDTHNAEENVEDEGPNEYYEELNKIHPIGIQIKRLRKDYKEGFGMCTVLERISLDIYKDQITALLGLDGSGKSTLLLLLAGILKPTNGEVLIDGTNIDHIVNLRSKISICYNNDYHFTYLTVEEHILLLGQIKGLSLADATKDAQKLMKKMRLYQNANSNVSELSAVMRRTLTLALGVIGNTSVLLLDEPVTGLDPSGKRDIWDIILRMRETRTIVVTTHSMAEADVLGDRIAILDRGFVKCYGSSGFLKRKYGTGYNLMFICTNECDVTLITQVVQTYVPAAELKNQVGAVLNYALPKSDAAKLPDLFDYLDAFKKSQLGIVGINLSIAQIDEVFLKVVEPPDEVGVIMTEFKTERVRKIKNAVYRNTGQVLILQRFLWLTWKIVQIERRKYWIYGIELFLTLFILIGALASKTIIVNKDNEELRVDLGLYQNSKVLYAGGNADVVERAIRDFKGSPVASTDVRADILAIGKNDSVDLNENYFVAIEVNGNEGVAYYAPTARRSSEIAINLLTNVMSDQKIFTYNQPFYKSSAAEDLDSAQYWTNLWIFGLYILLCGSLHLPAEERITGFKNQQVLMGVGPFLYWASIFFVDYVKYLVVVLIYGIILSTTAGSYFRTGDLCLLFVLIILFGISTMLLVFVMSFLPFKESTTFCILVLCGASVFLLSGFLVEIRSSWKTQLLVIGSYSLLLIFPLVAMRLSLTAYFNVMIKQLKCRQFYITLESLKLKENNCVYSEVICCKMDCDIGPCISVHKFDYDFMLAPVLTLIISSILFGVLLWALESGRIDRLKTRYETYVDSEDESDIINDDVEQEKNRVDYEMSARVRSQFALIAAHLTKRYPSSGVAVKDISFAVLPGQCFGLLGTNGSGKSTLFKMLTGSVIPSSGDALIGNYSLRNQRLDYFYCIGYCPQVDAMASCMSVLELLTFIANLKGLAIQNISPEINLWMDFLGLSEIQHFLIKDCSTGTKRKVSTAIALIGSPPVVLLDVPTTGVDPGSRRALWGIISSLQRVGQAVLFTSNSMFECEAMCDRVAVMVNGKFRCIGSIPYLKERFGTGFTIRIKLKQQEDMSIMQAVDNLKQDISDRVHLDLKDENQALLHYRLNDPSYTWSDLFRHMEAVKEDNPLVDEYTVSDTTLEEMFLSSTKKPAEGEDVSRRSGAVAPGVELIDRISGPLFPRPGDAARFRRLTKMFMTQRKDIPSPKS